MQIFRKIHFTTIPIKLKGHSTLFDVLFLFMLVIEVFEMEYSNFEFDLKKLDNKAIVQE